MILYDYAGTLKQGRKQYQISIRKGEYPYLPALDGTLSYTEIVSEVNLGIIDIPLGRIVGTRTKEWISAPANNFIPLLSEKSESEAKWVYLYDHQIGGDIHSPIIAYGLIDQFHVQEDNKEASVLKHLNISSISSQMTRLIPRRNDDKDTKLCYEFLDFYQVSFSCNIRFNKEGSYTKLLEAMGKGPGQVWSNEEREYFKAVCNRFSKVLSANGDNTMDLIHSDAFLAYAEIFGYEQVKERTESETQKNLVKIKDEILLAAGGNKIVLAGKPGEVDDGPVRRKSWLLPSTNQGPKDVKIASIHAKTAEIPSWTYGHELEWDCLEQAFGGNMQTLTFGKADTKEETATNIDLVIAAGYDVIFITASSMINPNLKTVVQHPGAKIFNYSVNTSHSSVCTCYGRMYESEFLMGAITTFTAQSDKLECTADYPVSGTIVNINVLALGTRMTNPYVRMCLEWPRLKNARSQEASQKEGVSYIPSKDMITSRTASREYGLYHKEEDGTCVNLTTPTLHWGKFYGRIVKIISHGSSELKGTKGKQAINYWWGMSVDMIDVICPQNLSHDTNRPISLLKSFIRAGGSRPFDELICSQSGVVQCKEGESLSPQEIITMNWLAGNVVGRIPNFDELTPEAQLLVCLQGVRLGDNGDAESKQIEDTGSGGQ